MVTWYKYKNRNITQSYQRHDYKQVRPYFDKTSATQINNEKIEVKCPERPVQQLFFTLEESTFSAERNYYGHTIDLSIKNFINSCIKFSPVGEINSSCINLATGKFAEKTSEKTYENYEIITSQYINKLNLKYKKDSMVYNTTIIVNNTSLDKLNFFIDLNTGCKLQLYWFKEIFINVQPYDPIEHSIDETKSVEYITKKAFKLIDGLFVVENHAVFGCIDYTFNQNIKNELFAENEKKDNEKKNLYYTQKHFDILFSMPVSEKANVSSFSKFDFVCFKSLCNYYMDLDEKYPWRVDKIELWRNHQEAIKIESEMLALSSYEKKFRHYQIFSLIHEEFGDYKEKLNKGYLNLHEYQMKVYISDLDVWKCKTANFENNIFNLHFYYFYFINKLYRYKNGNMVEYTEEDLVVPISKRLSLYYNDEEDATKKRKT